MITLNQAVRAILAPLVLALILAAVGRWRRWRWMMPAAAGTAFVTGYGLLGVPRLGPIDGTDWLFWLTIPVTGLAILDSVFVPRWGWAFGAVAGVVAWMIIHPVVPDTVSPGVCWATAIGTAVAGAGLCLAAGAMGSRLRPWAVLAGPCAAVGAAAVVVLASDSASIGIRGLAAAASLGPLIPLIAGGSVRGVTILALAVLAGILVGGHFYAGVSWTQFAILMLSPLLLFTGAMVPVKRPRLAGVVAVLAVLGVLAPIVIPAVVAAKHAAESNSSDPYGD
jgi:hypothetical protein